MCEIMIDNIFLSFFQCQAGRKGVSQTVVGFIFGGFELMIFLSSPVFGNYVSFHSVYSSLHNIIKTPVSCDENGEIYQNKNF